MSLPELAEKNKKTEILTLLKQSGTNVNHQNTYGQSALFMSCWRNYTDLISLLLKHPNIHVNLRNIYGDCPFGRACADGNCDSVKLLLKDPRTDLNLQDNFGITPLMAACMYYGKTHTVQLLLAFGRLIDIDRLVTEKNAKVSVGSSALDIAKQKGKTEIVSLLHEYIANPLETAGK